ncbi:MAG TPA: SpoIID/LytB domain-containing protein [Longimicrobiaceae bacterium]|nr:SpoIID/LytB domain-containing protein [Longimicrobiaceae bacterium]
MRWRRIAALAALAAIGACAPRRPLPPLAPSLPRVQPEVKIGLAVDTDSVAVSAPGGLELVGATGSSPKVGGDRPVTVFADASGRLWYRVAGGTPVAVAGATLVARPRGDAPVSIAGHAYRGSALVRAAGPGRVTAINQVELENYLLGVVPRELGPVGDSLVEAAKAQAVAARTYAVGHLGTRSAQGFDLYATTQDQVYGGAAAESPTVSRAVRETAGEILTYRGEPIEAYYHSTCAGRTAAIDQVWNHAPVPYLVSVVDVNPKTGQAYDIRSSRFHWTVTWSVPQLEQILSRTLADSLPAGASSVGRLLDMQILRKTPSGRVKRMRISTTTGNFVVGGDRVRWILTPPGGGILNSSKFDVQVVRDASGQPVEVVANGGGWGHGIGMCQWGAMGRALAGQDYRTILAAYYPGTHLRKLY